MAKIVNIEVSARHIHLQEEHFKILFGKEANLTPKRPLLQPGEFKAAEKVEVKGPKGSFKSVAIVGPFRSKTQLEVSFSDAKILGLAPPVRASGDIEGSEGCKLVGPAGELELAKGVIVSQRHIHMPVDEARSLGIKDKDTVMVKVQTKERALIFDDVLVRVGYNYVLSMHIDTDEANAAGCAGNVYGEIIKKQE